MEIKEKFDSAEKTNDEIKALKNEIDNLNEEIETLKNEIESFKEILDEKNKKYPPKRYLTLNDILSIGEKYYDEARWNIYYVEMIEELKKMENIGSVLEIGPYKAPFIEGCDVIDKVDLSKDFPIHVNKVLVHDCRFVPYPIEDKKYDLVIASQVLEHLGFYGEQQKIFKEIARISKRAIIGLPYKWNRPLARDHHMIDETVFDAWQGEFKPVYERKSKWTILRIYEFGD